MRLYLIDYPAEVFSQPRPAWGTSVLTIAVIAPEDDFERVLDEATPVQDSIEFQPVR